MSACLSMEDTNHHITHCEFLINVNQYLNADCRLVWKYRNSGNCKPRRNSFQFIGSFPMKNTGAGPETKKSISYDEYLLPKTWVRGTAAAMGTKLETLPGYFLSDSPRRKIHNQLGKEQWSLSHSQYR